MALRQTFYALCVLVAILFILHASGGRVKLKAITQNQINIGINEFNRVAEGLEKLASDTKYISKISKLSGFLGVTGGVLAFMITFFPKEESEELRYMKKKFKEVNNKLDRISSDLDNVKDMIPFESQRTQYIGAAGKILFAYDQLTNQYFDKIAAINCSTARDCLREHLSVSESYIKTFNIKAEFYKIMKGTVESVSVFGDPLLDMIKTTYKCDIPKTLIFANGVIKLAFKSQQVILAYEKLTGTNVSISMSMKEWSSLVYNIRKKADDIKKDCNQYIYRYIYEDVNNKTYQSSTKTNLQAANEMKKALDAKYPWIYWTVVAYGAYGGYQHYGSSAFVNMPSKRIRVLRVIAQDKGTYFSQRDEFASAMEKVAKTITFPLLGDDNAEVVYKGFEKELQKTTQWSKLTAFLVLNYYADLQVAIDTNHNLYYYNERLMMLQASLRYIRFWASFKSKEQISEANQSNLCNNGGSSIRIPYTSKLVCSCKAFYYGEQCEKFDKSNLAKNVDQMLAITARVPKLTDIYVELLDMQNFIGVSFEQAENSVAALGLSLQEKFDDLNNKLTNEFQWANLIIQYSETISHLMFYLQKFQSLNSSDPLFLFESNALARHVLQPDGIERWASDLLHFISGRKDFKLLEHKPFLLIVMDKYKKMACSLSYKENLDSSWRQVIILQNQLYLMWAKAKFIIGQSADEILKKYESIVLNQKALIKNLTCELVVPNSSNLQCSGGYYAYPGLQLMNKCGADHYLVGNSLLSCDNGSSSCLACNCSQKGSFSSECSDQTGQCNCSQDYYGKTCHQSFCEWSPYGPCSKTCDYGGSKKRTLIPVIPGKSCTGNESIGCFNRCCGSDYHCTNNNKCIKESNKCNYDNDCGDSQDESSCPEECFTYYTPWGKSGISNYSHQINCVYNYNKQYGMRMFTSERLYESIRFSYKCCQFRKNICVGNDTHGSMATPVFNCGKNGFINRFSVRQDIFHNSYGLPYTEYQCCIFKNASRFMCANLETQKIDIGSGDFYYLANQSFTCRENSYLNRISMNMHSNKTQISYSYTCCWIIT